ncbi:MAG: hypothetical protein HKL99_14420 [Burkholderiales bacterium]|nr:hypothetical protein [Burkholderiales bacterium]
MNADHYFIKKFEDAARDNNAIREVLRLIENLEDATRENNALREVLRLIGLDAQKCIKAVNSPKEDFWYRATLGSISTSINPEDLAQRGVGLKAAASMDSVLSSLRIQS